jgi:hypothetical protein
MIPKWPSVDESITGIERYKIYRRYLRDGDILEWGSDKIIGRMIRMFTKKDVNHTGGVIRMKEFENEPGDRIMTTEATEKGFCINYLSRALEGYKGRVYVLPLKSPGLDNYRRSIVRCELDMVGIPYDFGGLFSNMFGRVSMNARQFFCSEGKAFSLDSSGVITLPLNKKGRKIAPRPGDFFKFGVTLPRVRIY